MPETTWWIKDRVRASKEGKKRQEYFKTELYSILMEWNDKSPGHSGIKFIKVKHSRIELEFTLYHMERFQKGLKAHNPKEIIIYDRYDLAISQVYLESDTPNKMLGKIFKKHNITKKHHELENTFTLDKINEILMDVDDFMEKYEEYELLDILIGDF